MMIEGEILSGLLSKLISDGVDISKTAIRNFVEGQYKSYQSLYSQIYTILICVLDKITYHCYDNNRDRIYEAAEILLREYRNSPQKGESPDYIRACLSSLHSRTDDANCYRLQTLLYEEFSKNEYQEVYRAIRLFQQEQKNRTDQAAFSELGKKVEEVRQLVAENSDGRGKDSEYGADKPGQVNRGEREGESGEAGAKSREIFTNNRKQDYIAQWNQCMFLHRAKGEKQLTLADAFVMPDCEGKTIAQNTGITSSDLFNEIIWKFADLPSASTMLITGVPGIGKSSVVSWIAHTYEENDRFILLRFRDWESEELEQGLLKAICRTLACKKEDLRGRILVLDGFDELKALNLREHILNRFLGDQLDIIGLKIIITSRPNYINTGLFENVFTLLPFNTDKIKKFHFLVTGTCPELGEYFENQDIFGIPVILYMAVMSNIDISQRATKPEIYGRIFAGRGGIFDRFSYEGIAYSEGAHILRNAENSKKYLEFLQNVAFWMFEENSLSLCLEEEDIPELEFDGESVKILEFPIRYLFENKESEIEFIHKSIYEYFVAEYLFTGIREGQAKGNAEALAGELADMLRGNVVSSEILEYLSYRLAKWEKEDKERRAQEKRPFKIARRPFCKDLLKEAFFCMLENGMCYFSRERSGGNIRQELTIFENMLNLCKMLRSPGELFVIKPRQEFVTYMAHLRIQEEKLHLADFDLSGAVFKNLSLKNISFERVNLSEATFDSVDLSGARFCQTNVSGAVFREVSLDRAEFSKTDLTNTMFQKSELRSLKVKESNLKTVFQNCRLQGSQIYCSDIKQIDFSESDIKYIQFIRDRIARESPLIFKNTIVDMKLLLEVERLFGDIVQNCRVDMCDNLLTYAEYCQFREKKQGKLQKEILNLLETGKNYSEWEEDADWHREAGRSCREYRQGCLD